MANPLFSKLFGLPSDPGHSARVQQNVDAVLRPVAAALANTPIMGAPAPAPILPDLLNAWGPTGGAEVPPSFHRDALGYVHVVGVVTNTTGGPLTAVVFVLPGGYRPKFNHRFAVRGGAATAQFLIVGPDGKITPEVATGAGAAISLDIIFLAEQ